MNGHFKFSYAGTGGAGTDTIQASLGTLVSNIVQQTWTLSPLSNGFACNGTYSGNFTGNITVGYGQNCTLVGGAITGSITQLGGILSIGNVTVKGNVQVLGGSSFSSGSNAFINGNLDISNVFNWGATAQLCRSSVTGNLTVQINGSAVQIGSASASCAGNTIGGNLEIQLNAGSTAIVGNTVTGYLQDQLNIAPTQVSDNTVTGNLSCQNNLSITGSGNTVTGQKTGQCQTF